MDIKIPQMDMKKLETIVNTGVRTKISFLGYLKRSFQELGWKYIFHDKIELMIIGVVGILMLLLSMANVSITDMSSLYQLTFLVSPILYLSVVVFSFYHSKEKGAFEIEMTCKYNLYQLAALRMFSFSIIGMFINTACIVVIGLVFERVDLIRMTVISITGLFLFSTVFLYSLMKFRWKFLKYIVIVAWFGINLTFYHFGSEVYLSFLMKIPLYIHFVITMVCAILYVRNLNKLVNYRRKKGEI
ncbi:hypothetical protein [Lachnoclostridium phytofermentans]|uniref:Uncharacterized protein n=1 Tax=Lachnoclostridium phytofermentans (strain ATCC 700394 / DSM 18823 / ISDg) TaxID=357809 RepID=A9KLG9_LACP7|nr:hypothetical protein [Lachnoclostridium phytofermentans]ABX41298.1 conserved hypothetical protein [Lachnoclostridium phytofermentans ISDg]